MPYFTDSKYSSLFAPYAAVLVTPEIKLF